MAQQVLEVQELVGQNRNRVHGQAGGMPIEPYRLFNLAPHRQGGYSPYGRRVRLADVELPDIARLLGHDETGVSSYCSVVGGSGTLSVFRDRTVHAQASDAYPVASDAVHMDNAGAYIGRDAFLVFDRDDRVVEPIASSVQAIPSPGSPIFSAQVSAAIGSFTDVAYGNDYFIAVTNQGFIYRTNDNGRTWEQVAAFSGFDLESIDYGNSVWIASSDNGYIFRSEDDGDTWDQRLVGTGPWDTRAVSYGGESDWYISGQGGSGLNSGIYKSSNGGMNWSQVDDLYSSGNGHSWFVDRIAVDVTKPPSTRQYAGVANFRNPLQARQEVFIDRSDGGDSFNFASTDILCGNQPASATVNRGFAESTFGFSWTEWCGSYMCAVNSVNGDIAVSDDLSVSCGVARWNIEVRALGGLSETRKVKYNRANGSIAVVGGMSSPRVWLGTRPNSLTRNSEIEEAFDDLGASAVLSVAFNGNGVGVYVGSNGVIVSSDAAFGLAEGSYNLYFVSYFNTKAGRFVYSIARQELSFDSLVGNTVTFEAQTRESILASNAWLAGMADPSEAEAIVDSLRFDAYIQYIPPVTTPTLSSAPVDEAPQTTIRYAFTEPFPSHATDSPVPIDRTIGELPIGRQIVSLGLPTTAVFEKSRIAADDLVKSRTAVHAGRVWGLAAQDEDRWPQADGISLEIANQFNRFVLTYSETGWANLISDQSFIPIQPTQSANFTGIVSSPSGLMVMFDNEIFLVSGDPAFGNVSVELFLDMLGCDLGTTPARMGGFVFVIWNGRVWVVQAGQAADISRSQWRPEDPFVRVAAEPQTRSLLAVTQSGRVLRYFLDDQFWMTDPVNRDDFILGELLPNCVCEPDDFMRFVEPTGEVWITQTDGTPDTPHIVYRDMDFGFPERRTPLYMAKATFEGPIVGSQFVRTAVDYDASALPALFYEAAQSTNGSTYATLAANPGGIAPVMGDPGSQRVGTMAFRMPLRVARSFSMSVRFELRGLAYDDVIKPPIRFFHAAGGETR